MHPVDAVERLRRQVSQIPLVDPQTPEERVHPRPVAPVRVNIVRQRLQGIGNQKPAAVRIGFAPNPEVVPLNGAGLTP